MCPDGTRDAFQRAVTLKKRKLLVVSCAALIGMSGRGAEAMPIEVPPAREWEWDIRPANILMSKELRIRRGGSYRLSLFFHRDLSTNRERMNAFIGDGSYEIFTNDPKNPIRIIPRSDNLSEVFDKIRRGEYVQKMTNPGTAIPIKTIFKKIEANNTTMNLIDGAIITASVFYKSDFGLERLLSEIVLKSGRYLLELETTKYTDVPKDIRTSVLFTRFSV